MLGVVCFCFFEIHGHGIFVNVDVEKRHGVEFEKEREKRASISGLVHGIHPMANGGGKGLKTQLRETDCKPIDVVPRLFV